MRERLLELLLPAVVVGVLLSAPAQAGTRAPAPGDLFVARLSGGDASVEWYQPDGSLNRRLKSRKARLSGGLAFDPVGNLYVTDYGNGRVLRYGRSGKPAGTLGSGFVKPSSIVFDKAGKAYVGQQDDIDVVKLNRKGRRLAAIDLEIVEGGGTGQIDLAPDQCTIYYRSQRKIRRFDACRGRTGGDFAELGDKGNEGNEGNGNKGTLRSMPSGGVLVANQAKIIRLNTSGQVVKDYDVDGEDKWSHLALDPTGGGKSFWAAGGETGKVYRFKLVSGDIDRELAVSNVTGLAVRGDMTAPPPPATTPVVENTEGNAESDHTPTIGTSRLATKAPDPSELTFGGEIVAPAKGFTLTSSSPRKAALGRSQPVVGVVSNADEARPQVRNRSSGVAAGRRGLSSQPDLVSDRPRAEPQLPGQALVVPPPAVPAEVPAAPLVQGRVPPRLRSGIMADGTYEGFVARGRGPADDGRPLVVGAAAVMLFGAGLAYRRQAERARANALHARFRIHPRRN